MKGLSQISSKNAYPLLAESLRLNGSLRLPAVGTSMVPAIQPGDVLTIQPVNSNEIALGDLVVYAREHALVVHRVVRMASGSGETRLVTRGDRLLRDDAPIFPADLLGRVAGIERKNRRVSMRAFSNWAERALSLILRRSEHATYLFLRANQLWSGILSKGNM